MNYIKCELTVFLICVFINKWVKHSTKNVFQLQQKHLFSSLKYEKWVKWSPGERVRVKTQLVFLALFWFFTSVFFFIIIGVFLFLIVCFNISHFYCLIFSFYVKHIESPLCMKCVIYINKAALHTVLEEMYFPHT